MAVNEAWFSQGWQERLLVDAEGGEECFADFANAAYRALTVDEIRRFSPDSLLACLHGFWRFADQSSSRVACRVFNPSYEEDGWEAEGTIIEIVAGEIPFLLNTLRMALAKAGYTVEVQLDLNMPVSRNAQGRIQKVCTGNPQEARQYQAMLHLQLNQRYGNEDLMVLQTQVLTALEHLQNVVADFDPMQSWCDVAASRFAAAAKETGSAELQEFAAFFSWLGQGHFTFLAARLFERAAGARLQGLGLLQIPGFNLDLLDDFEPAERPGIHFAKSTTRSPIHHDRYGDVIMVALPAEGAVPAQELRFYGLYTSRVHQHDPSTIPVLRQKLVAVEQRTGFYRLSSDGRNFDRLLRHHPRDELLLANEDEILDSLLPLVQQRDKNQLRISARVDACRRFVFAFIYVPRAAYSEDFAERAADFMQSRLRASAYSLSTDSPEEAFTRLYLVLELSRDAELPALDLPDIEQSLRRITLTWDDELLRSLLDIYPAPIANPLFQRYQSCLPDSYREATRPLEAVSDIAMLEQLSADVPFAIEIFAEEGREARLKIYHWRDQLPLSSVMPILDSFQLRALDEQAYCLVFREDSAWLHDFQIELPLAAPAKRDERLVLLREALKAVWEKQCDTDFWNGLVSVVGLSWREVVVFRAYGAYLKQIGFQYSLLAKSRVLIQHAPICRALAELFFARSDPAIAEDERQPAIEIAQRRLHDLLEKIERLDEDRIVRAFLSVINATVRTNYFAESGRSRLSLKLATHEIPEAPLPRPLYEILVYSPAVQAIHLRFGRVARGGIRWSDRNEDFRTEILGLVKAQQVKNALIVPVGAKGGFIVRAAPADPAQLAGAGLNAYKSFLAGLLDLTDNVVNGATVPPAQVVCHDEPDPYLVVAADKGTARFSDTANAVAADYGFWLGDAFASGGSHGYDHKQMGITARGAFVSLKRLGRSLGFDPLLDALTVAGIGDMSGDVFGNGLLLSQSIKLVAAFNHAHIFLDPNPDPMRSYLERRRLFDLPRSGWPDYDRALISPGGGVYSRHDRRVALSPEVKALLHREEDFLSPDELIKAILQAPLDVLWNGGIGTYVKASDERQGDVGDKANDAVRVDGRELGARIVVEGGNLGMTQRGRIEYALKGGRCHTDFIDNSAGVDCSDHEVNMKIFFQQEIMAGRLALGDRDTLLRQWQDDVTECVLADNLSQTRALAISVHEAGGRHREFGELCSWLEQVAGLDRALECLPDPVAWNLRARDHQPLTRPELAILMAYNKNHLKEMLAKAPVLTEPLLQKQLLAAFPAAMQEHFGAALFSHPLAAALVATRWATVLSDGLGLSSLPRLLRYRDASLFGIVRAFAMVHELLDLPGLQGRLASAAGTMTEPVVLTQWVALQRFARRATGWFLRLSTIPTEVLLNRYRPLNEVIGKVGETLSPYRREYWERDRDQMCADGFPAELAAHIAALDQLLPLLEVMTLADRASATFADAAVVYFGLETRLDLTEVQRELQGLGVSNGWEAEARDQYRLGLLQRLSGLAEKALAAWLHSEAEDLEGWLDDWLGRHDQAYTSWRSLRQRLGGAELASYAPYVVLLAELDHLILAINGDRRRYH